MTVTEIVTKLKGRVELALFGPVRGPDLRDWHRLVGQQCPIAWLKHNVTTETSCCNSNERHLDKFVLCQRYSILKNIQIKDAEAICVWWDISRSLSVHGEGLGSGRDPSNSSAYLVKPRQKSGCLVFAPKSERVTFQMQTILEMLSFEPKWCIYLSVRGGSSVYFQLCCGMQCPHAALFAYLRIALVDWHRTYALSFLGLWNPSLQLERPIWTNL
jgi:hypothetical protein